MAQIAGRLDVDNVLAELTPEQLVEWEAALCVLDLDASRWIAGKVAEVLHEVAERFNGSGGQYKLPTHEDFMGLLAFDVHSTKPQLNIPVQSQEEIARTLAKLK